MNKTTIFNFRLDSEDRRLLEQVARRLERSRSDALRWLIRRAAAEESGITNDELGIRNYELGIRD